MAGGTWEAQNKLQPGIYINFKSSPKLLATIGDRGIVAIAREMDWGATDELIMINSLEDVYPKLGYDITSDKLRFIREILLGTTLSAGASKIMVYRLPTTDGAAASATINKVIATAKYPGVRGNDITVVITPNPDTEVTEGIYAVFTVSTIVDGVIQDSQVVGSFTSISENTPAKVADLKNNAWVSFTGQANDLVSPTSGAPLTGGLNGTIATTAYSSFLTILEPKSFNVVIYDGSDAVTKSAFASFVKRLSYNTGKYCQAVLAKYKEADNETVISVKNGYELNDGAILTPEQATWWVGGATAGARNNQSLTYGVHPNAVDAVPRLTNTELNDSILEGSFVFFEEYGKVKVLTDINTFTSFNQDKSNSFRKNRVIRVLFAIANDIYKTFALYYVGKTDNNETGRNLLKAEIVGYINQLQGNNAVQNFTADDVEVLPGNDIDSVIINVNVQPVDSIEKIYMTVTVS